MQKREVIKAVLQGKKPPYVPWHFQFTIEALDKLRKCLNGDKDIERYIDNHILELGSAIGFFKDLRNSRFQDVFGVVWNRSVDKDIGIVEGCMLADPDLKKYNFPDPKNEKLFEDIPVKIQQYPDRFRTYCIGFSLFERAWSLRGMENLMMDFIVHPEFVHELMKAIADYNIIQAREAMKYDIDAVYFGDDWGQQNGLIMGYPYWKEFIYPHIKRMYSIVRNEGKYVMIHSCGDVDELLDDLIEIGVNCFNPFQPEVMDIGLVDRYRHRISFHGGLSTQKTLPFGTSEQVQAETELLLSKGAQGSYIFAPAHAVEGDVPVENMLCFIETAKRQAANHFSTHSFKRRSIVNYSQSINKKKSETIIEK